jgi:hypothetical protein
VNSVFVSKIYGLDSASLDAIGNAATAHAQGVRFWCRYSAGVGNSNPKSQFKLTKPGEINALVGRGIDFVANSEWYENRCTEGAAAGKADGTADLAFWKSRGLARGASIYISWDTAPQSSQYNAVEAYIRAYNAALGGYYKADGLYAGIPALIEMSRRGVIRHGWIPSAASWSVARQNLKDLGISAPPAVTTWNLWQPTPSQVVPAIAYLLKKLAGDKLVSCIWQTGNHRFGGGADENITILAGPLGSHREAQAAGSPIIKPPVKPPVKPPAAKHYGPMHGHGVPGIIARGSQQYFGSIDGPRASHGGFNPGERAYVKLIQQQLVFLGFVPGHSNPNDGWADGIFDTRGGGVGRGPTSQAVARFQHRFMPGTKFYGQVWWDDWTKLASLAKEDV